MKEYLSNMYSGSKDSFYKLVTDSLKAKKKEMIVTVNPETLTLASKDKVIKEMLNNQDILKVADGIAVVKTSKLFKINIKERITGIDLVEYLLKIADKNKYTVYFYGAREEVITKLITNIKEKYNHINILGYSNGYQKDTDKVMQNILKLKPDIVLIALGIPKQEKLIYKYFDKVSKGIYIGVGGSFDVLSGQKKRAPRIFIKLNLEWLYRIIKEPKRLKRFFQYNLKYLFKCIYERYEEIINYLIIGLLTTLISLVTYFICVKTIFNPDNSLLLQLANIISWFVAVIFAYITNRKIVFKSKNKNIKKETIEFLSSRVFSLLVDMLFMFLTVSLFHFNNYFMKILSNIIVIILNYILSKFIVFKK